MATIKDFSCVGGMENHIETLKETVLFPLMYGEVYSRFNIKPPRGLLFYGPPGTGKTLMAGALAFECSSAGRKVSFISRKGADCLSKWIGESEKKLQDIFLRAKQTKPCIIFFDEIDGLAPVRSSRQDFVHTSVVCTLLALMDGLDNNSEVIVIGATNRIEAIDPALRRPGRFDKELYFPLPCFNTRKQILSVHVNSWKQKPAKRFLSYLASKTIGFCGSDLQALCAEAVMCCVRRNYPQIYTSKKKHRINGRFLQRIKEARRTLPSLLYVPDITAWWELVDERARVVFASLMRGLDRTVTILILTTANCPHAELPEEIQQLYNECQGEVFEVSAPEVTERKTFFEQLFFPSGSTPSITENRSQDSSSSDVIEVPPGKRVSTEIDLRAKPGRVQSVHSTSPFGTALKREYSAAGEACRASKRARMKSEARSTDEKVKPGQVLENMPSNRTTELLRRTVAVTARSNSQQLESLYALLERAIQNHKSDVYATVIRCLDNYNGSRKLKRKARKKNDYPGGKCSKKLPQCCNGTGKFELENN
ncbi:ATPase family AAA domain-containing protein 2-like [Neodiprion fabricii]|uniref:ATPase family AAA domain-containing protein 2-like n=1 Tax=Neodiprion fabricii TaxID=2872261 RepID=UPI001ED8CD4E|nr:ATPase family AAA domain-containing protein 2-like [Neodiprion fabricii]